jgi:hypothetical protein
MATGHWKLTVNSEVSAADVPSHLGRGPFQILRTDHQAGKTTIYFSGEEEHFASARFAVTPVVVNLAAVSKL